MYSISSGEIEELNDLLPPMKDDDYNSDSSYDKPTERKRSRRKQPYDHNAQLVFDKDSINPPSFIPPLMALNVLPEPDLSDKDYNRNSNGNSDRDIWQSNQNNPWAGNNNGSSFMANNNNNNMPPSLLNITIQPPDMSPTDNSNGSSWDRRAGDNSFRNRDDKSRRRDSDGRRGSRFDNGNESRRRSGNEGNSRSSDKSGRTIRSGRNRRRD